MPHLELPSRYKGLCQTIGMIQDLSGTSILKGKKKKTYKASNAQKSNLNWWNCQVVIKDFVPMTRNTQSPSKLKRTYLLPRTLGLTIP